MSRVLRQDSALSLHVRDSVHKKTQVDVIIATTSAHAHVLQVKESERPPLQTHGVSHHKPDAGANAYPFRLLQLEAKIVWNTCLVC